MKVNHLFGNVLLVIIPVTAVLIIAEVMLRFTNHVPFLSETEQTMNYRYDEVLGWFPQENSSGMFVNKIPVSHNSRGFRDEEHFPDSSKAIMVLGDSFVWGFDVKEEQRFTEHLGSQFQDKKIFNLGVSGYGTDQSWILMQEHFDFYSPEVVMLFFCSSNDFNDNTSNFRYLHYYKPYFEMNESDLELKGIPVPQGYAYFMNNNKLLSNSYLFRLFVNSYYNIKYPRIELQVDPTFKLISEMNDFVTERGGEFFVGIEFANYELVEFFNTNNIRFINLENPYYNNTAHWTEDGHIVVADRIADFLVQELEWNKTNK